MTDEEFYLLATNEVEGEQKKPALWAKVMALAEGDRDKAKYQYIKLRVAQLIEEKKEERPVFTKKIIDEEVGRNVKKGKTFEVYKHPTLGFRPVKIGFNWPAFFFGLIWMLFSQLWAKTVIWIVIYAIISMPEWSPPSYFFLFSTIAIIIGFKGNKWRSSKLKSRGFKLVKIVKANTKDKAIAKASNT